jgi:cytochrome c553
MKSLSMTLGLIAALGLAQNVTAANLYAGKAQAAMVCSQCHGIVNPSADAPFPPLAGRDEAYLKMALKQYRDKTRQSDIMNNIAGSLSDQDIENIMSYYSGLKPE